MVSVAAIFVDPKSKDSHAERSDFLARAKATYLDEFGDKVTVSSDEELEDGYSQFICDTLNCSGKSTQFCITVTIPKD